jgi:hypothetical protein
LKRQPKVSTEQKHLNEKEIQSCFTFMNSFWGFDCMDFNLGENLIVDIEELKEYRKKNPDKVKKLNYNSNQIEDLIIQSREFGRLEIGKIYKKESRDTVNYCLLQLNHGGLNFETLSISAIRKKLIGSFLVAKQTNFIMFVKENMKIMLIYQHSLLFQMYSLIVLSITIKSTILNSQYLTFSEWE